MMSPVPGAPLDGDENEITRVQQQFGVGRGQVERDRAVSFLLAEISRRLGTDEILFVGGTALARTHLPRSRLSEDIDLIALADRRRVARSIEDAAAGMRRRYGRGTWRPRLMDARGSTSASLSFGPLTLRVQLLSKIGYPEWPSEVADLHQRYRDAPGAKMRVPTRDAMAASKLSAWIDRRAPRDLFDLWELGRRGWITRDAAELFRSLGQFTSVPEGVAIFARPGEQAWRDALAHQTRLSVTAAEAATSVARYWRAASR